MKKSFKNIFLLLFTLSTVSLNAQTFGFGCLGLSGFYGGYGVHTYEANGLNESIPIKYNSIPTISNDLKFEQATGFRFGGNILRANFNDVFLTAKAFYQFSKENKSADYSLSGSETNFDFQLTTNHWGVGIDFGFPLFSFLDLKLVEGGVTFYQVEYKEKIIVDNNVTTEDTYKNDGTDIGYYVGSGLIINLVQGYISIEGTAMYHFMDIGQLKDANSSTYPLNSVDKSFIEKGGFAAVIQLNLGFPL